MAYSTSYPPYLVVAAPAGGLASTSTSPGSGGGGNIWFYRSTDPIATVKGTSYFSNGDALGMKLFDMVILTRSSTAYAVSDGVIGFVSAVTAGAGATVGVLQSTTYTT